MAKKFNKMTRRKATAPDTYQDSPVVEGRESIFHEENGGERTKTAASLLPRSQGRICLRKQYNRTFMRSDPKDRRSSKNTSQNYKAETNEDSTLTTWSESTKVSSWNRQGATSRRHTPTTVQHYEINLIEHTPSECYGRDDPLENGVSRNPSPPNRKILVYNDSGFDDEKTNSIRDRYAIVSDEKNDNNDVLWDAYCSMNLYNRDYNGGCFRSICTNIRPFQQSPKQQSQNHNKNNHDDVDIVDVEYSNESISPLVQNDVTHDDVTDQWDCNVVPIVGPNKLSKAYFLDGQEQNDFPGIFVEFLGQPTIPSFFVSDPEQERVDSFVMSTASIVLREFLGVNITIPTRSSRLRKNLDARSTNSVTKPRQDSQEADARDEVCQFRVAPQTRCQRLLTGLHWGEIGGNESADTPSGNKSERDLICQLDSSHAMLGHQMSRLSRILQFRQYKMTEKEHEKVTEIHIPLFQVAFGLLLVQAMSLAGGNTLPEDFLSRLKMDWMFRLLQWIYENSCETEMLICWAHVFVTQHFSTPSLEFQSPVEIPVISTRGSSNATESTHNEEINEIFLDGYVPPDYVQDFQHNLDEAMDLSADYVNAHCETNCFLSVKLDDDGMADELMNLQSIEQEIDRELRLDRDAFPGDSVQEDERVNTDAAIDELCKVVLTISSSCSGNDDDESSLDQTETSFSVQDAHKVVVDIMQRLHRQTTANGHPMHQDLAQEQQKLMDNLALLSRSSSQLSYDLHNSDEGVEFYNIEIDLKTSSISVVSFSAESTSIAEANDRDSKEMRKASLEGCESIPGIGKLSSHSLEDSPAKFPSLIDSSTSSGSMEDNFVLHNGSSSCGEQHSDDTALLEDDCYDVFQNVSESTEASETFKKRRQRTIWGSLLSYHPRVKAEIKRNTLSTTSSSPRKIFHSHHRNNSHDGAEQFHAAPRRPALIIGSISRSAFQKGGIISGEYASGSEKDEKKERTTIPNIISELDLSEPVRHLSELQDGASTASISEIESGMISYDLSELEFGRFGQPSDVSHATWESQFLSTEPSLGSNAKLPIESQQSGRDLPCGTQYVLHRDKSWNEEERNFSFLSVEVIRSIDTQEKDYIDSLKQSRCMIYDEKLQNPVWSLSPIINSFCSISEAVTASEGWSLSPKLTPVEVKASIETTYPEMQAMQEDITPDLPQLNSSFQRNLVCVENTPKERNLKCGHPKHDASASMISKYWDVFLNDPECSKSQYKSEYNAQLSHEPSKAFDDYNPFEAAKRIPEAHSGSHGPGTPNPVTQQDYTCVNTESTTSEELGVEAFLLPNDAINPPHTTSISDISGSTDAEYTDSESTEWTVSITSSLEAIELVEASESDSFSVPFSAIKIGIHCHSMGEEDEEIEMENHHHPLKAAFHRKHTSKHQHSAAAMKGILGTISDIGNVVWNSWKRNEWHSDAKLANTRTKEQLMERLRGIKYY